MRAALERWRGWFLSVASLCLTACSTDDAPSERTTSDGGGDSGAIQCVERSSECLTNQKICVIDDSKEVCVECPEGQYAATANRCDTIPGTVLAHEFDEFRLEPAEELNSICQSWTLDNETELWVNAVEMVNNGGYHHSNWLFVPDDMHDGPDGAWRCAEREYTELAAAVAGGVLFAQSTQAIHEVQKFPEGVAVRLPPHARIIGGTHLLNTLPEAFDTEVELRVYTIDVEDVDVPLAPFRLSYVDLTIPPKTVSEFTGECDFAASMDSSPAGALDMELYYVLPHYHALGHSFRLEKFGGDADGELIFEIGGFNGEARGRAFNPPIDMSDASGFRFTCGFENPRDTEVGWGIGDQEMCVMLAFARSDYAFDATVSQGGPDGEAERAKRFTGHCGILPLEFGRGQGGIATEGD